MITANGPKGQAKISTSRFARQAPPRAARQARARAAKSARVSLFGNAITLARHAGLNVETTRSHHAKFETCVAPCTCISLGCRKLRHDVRESLWLRGVFLY